MKRLLLYLFVPVCCLFIAAANMTGRNSNTGVQRSDNWLLLNDDIPMYFGWDSDWDLHYDATNSRFEVEPLAANGVFRFGAASLGVDVQFIGSSESNALIWNASDNQLQTSGSVTLDVTGSLTMENDEAWSNTPDGTVALTFNDDAVELGDLQIISSNVSTSDNDYLQISWWIEDSASESTEIGRFKMVCTDQTTATEDSRYDWAVITAGTLASELSLTGAALYPSTESGLTLGALGSGWGNTYIDGTLTATTSTATFGAAVVNTSLVPDADAGATFGAADKGWGNSYFGGTITATTGTATFGAVVVNTSLIPDTDGGMTLGAAGTGIGDSYFDGNVTATTGTSTFGATVINTSLVPDTDGGATFGAADVGWGNAYFGGTITATTGTATFGAVVVNTSLIPDTDGGATLGADGTGIGNVFINGNTVTTGTVRIGVSGNAAAQWNAGQVTISSGATSATVSLADIDADDVVMLTALENISTGTVYAQIEAGLGFDICLVDCTDGAADLAASDYTFAYEVIMD